MKPTVGSLFAGIGGFDLGFERAGFETVWQVEIDEYCRRVLERHFPRAERFGDIRECGAHNLKPVDCITGGFPCQPFSTSGQRRSISDDRWLWPEMYRVVRALKPKFVVAENVSGLAFEFDWILEQVCTDLESASYEVQPLVVPACAFGSPHRRDRVWILAHSVRCNDGTEQKQQQEERSQISSGNAWWSAEPAMDRVVHGIPRRMDRDRALGNAVVPQISFWIAERIKESTHASEVMAGQGPRIERPTANEPVENKALLELLVDKGKAE